MKKITLALCLMSLGLQAQNFPSPYCDISSDDVTIEEITSVNFNESSMVNEDLSSVLINKTSTMVNIMAGETYTLTVQGNTYGNFDNDIVAFIDWNQNEVLDDNNEVYEIGRLTNSTGQDGVSVEMDITVPADVLPGETRIRITKTYRDDQSQALINACAIEFNPFGQGAFPGYGQALDFTLNVETLSTNTFDKDALSVYPVPAKDVLTVNYKSIIETIKIYNLIGQEVFSKEGKLNKQSLDLSKLNSGVHIIKLYSEEGSHSFKIVKE